MTPAQDAARVRNMRIFRLRGLAVQVCVLSEPGRSLVRALIDHELKALGAATMREHHDAIILGKRPSRGNGLRGGR